MNITLSLPAEDVRRAKVLAARRGSSVSRLLADLLRDLLEQQSGYALAKERHLATLEHGADLGTNGRLRWTRDELHER